MPQHLPPHLSQPPALPTPPSESAGHSRAFVPSGDGSAPTAKEMEDAIKGMLFKKEPEPPRPMPPPMGVPPEQMVGLPNTMNKLNIPTGELLLDQEVGEGSNDHLDVLCFDEQVEHPCGRVVVRAGGW